MSKSKYLDALVLAILIALAVLVSVGGGLSFLPSLFFFFILPGIWLSFRKPERVKKLLLFSLVTSFPFFIIVDILAAFDQSWYVPSIFPRLFGMAAWEDFVWLFSLAYLVTIFYEYFLDKGKDRLIWKQMRSLILLVSILLASLLVILFVNPEFLHIPYAYLWMGSIFLFLPTILMLIHFPSLLLKFFSTLAYFFPLAIAAELTALKLEHYSYPGEHFIGWIHTFGYRFPVEELIFWFFLIPIATLSYYEYFDDDRA